MITKIDILNVSTFGNTTIDDLKKLNFFFGANGTGKTTISKVIADWSQFPNCEVTWKNGLNMERRVFNRDFVENNFSQQIPGVFTLGTQEADTFAKIEATKDEITKLNEDMIRLKNTLQGADGNGGKNRELADLENKYLERFFTQKQKHDEKLAGGFEGVRSSKARFKEKVLSEATNNTSDLLSLANLESSAVTVFSDTLTQAQSIEVIQPQKLLSLENASILGKRIIGKEDVDIATIINKLNNSDWVRQGLPYYEANDGVCPFCQQRTEENFAKSLSEYFDEAFEQDNIAIQSLELLWEDVRAKPDKRNNLTIQNTLRRILENYFKILGGIPLEELYKSFDGDNKIKCKDLCSWVNDGSHSGGIFSDEHYSSPDDATVEKYLQVFKEIFEQCKHTAHYNKMMGIYPEVEQEEDTPYE